MWGTAGWFLVALIPIAFWVAIVGLLVVVLGGHVPAELEEPAVETEPARERNRDRSGLGWRPPVPSHH